MDKILDKLGIYDLVAVLLSGIIITYLTLICCNLFNYDDCIKIICRFSENKAIDSVSFLIISYLLGIIFQELGSLFMGYCVNKKDRLLINVYEKHEDTRLSISLSEKSMINAYVEKNICPDLNVSDIYNYCKYVLLIKDKMKKSDKHQYLSVQSRSLSLYFFMLFWVFVYNGFLASACTYFFGAIVSLFISLLLFVRCVRFAKLRYVEVFKSFCYEIKVNLNKVD